MPSFTTNSLDVLSSFLMNPNASVQGIFTLHFPPALLWIWIYKYLTATLFRCYLKIAACQKTRDSACVFTDSGKRPDNPVVVLQKHFVNTTHYVGGWFKIHMQKIFWCDVYSFQIYSPIWLLAMLILNSAPISIAQVTKLVPCKSGCRCCDSPAW